MKRDILYYQIGEGGEKRARVLIGVPAREFNVRHVRHEQPGFPPGDRKGTDCTFRQQRVFRDGSPESGVYRKAGIAGERRGSVQGNIPARNAESSPSLRGLDEIFQLGRVGGGGAIVRKKPRKGAKLLKLCLIMGRRKGRNQGGVKRRGGGARGSSRIFR